MARRVLAALLGAAAVAAQTAPTNVAAVAGDGEVLVTWTGANDANIASYTILATPPDAELSTNASIAALAPTWVVDDPFDSFNSNEWASQFAGACIASAAQPCSAGAPTSPPTFSYANSALTMTVAPGYAFGAPAGLAFNLSSNWGGNGVPMLLRAASRVGEVRTDGVWATRMTFDAALSAAVGTSAAQAGFVVYAMTGGLPRPVLHFFYRFVNLDVLAADNNFFVRAPSSFLPPTPGFTTVSLSTAAINNAPVLGRLLQTVELYLIRDTEGVRQRWRFAAKTDAMAYPQILKAATATAQPGEVISDGLLPDDFDFTNMQVGLFAENLHPSLYRNVSFDWFRVARNATWDAYIQRVGEYRNRAATVGRAAGGICSVPRVVQRAGISPLAGTGGSTPAYSIRLRELYNAVPYSITVRAEGAAPLAAAASGTVTPMPTLPTLTGSPGTVRPALFLDSRSIPRPTIVNSLIATPVPVPPVLTGQGYAKVMRWRDVSGAGRDFVQQDPHWAPGITLGAVNDPFPGIGFVPGSVAWNTEMLQEARNDTGLALHVANEGLSFFFAARPNPTGGYHSVLLSRMDYSACVNLTAGYLCTQRSDGLGWELTSSNAPVSNVVAGAWKSGLRAVLRRNPGSSQFAPNVEQVAQFWSSAGAPDNLVNLFSGGQLYNYNLWRTTQTLSWTAGTAARLSLANFNGGATSVASGVYLADGCRGINNGWAGDTCWAVDSTAAALTPMASAPTLPAFQGSYEYTWHTPAWPEARYPINDQVAPGGIGRASVARMRLSDTQEYAQTSYGLRWRPYQGQLHGILIYRNPITNRADRAIVQAWLSQRYGLSCPVPSFPRSALGPSPLSPLLACTPGATVMSGVACTATCTSGSRLGGINEPAEVLSCARGSFVGKGLWCGATCPLMLLPANGLGCTRIYHQESFDNYTTGAHVMQLVQYDTWPPMAAPVQQAQWSMAAGTLRADSPHRQDGCAALRPSLFVPNRPIYAEPASLAPLTIANYSIDVRVTDAGVRAGLAFRVTTTSTTSLVAPVGTTFSRTYYRVTILGGATVGVGARFESVVHAAFGVPTLVNLQATPTVALLPGMSATLGFEPTKWYQIVAVVSGTTLRVLMGERGQALVQVYSVVNTLSATGTIGAFSDAGEAFFDNMALSGPCGSNNQCQADEAGGCAYSCAAGYIPTGNATMLCGTDGNYLGTPFSCLPPPPAVATGIVLTAVDTAAVDTFVGKINATIIGAVPLIFSFTSGNWAVTRDAPGGVSLGNVTDVFAIDLCSGVITVAKAGVLAFDVLSADGRANIRLTVRVAMLGTPEVFAETDVTVVVTRGRRAPYFVSGGVRSETTATTVFENRALGASIAPTMALYAPSGPAQQAALVYDIIAGNELGIFAIGNTTGVLTVARPFAPTATWPLSAAGTPLAFLDFEGAAKSPAIPTAFPLIIRATDSAFPTLQGSVACTVTVADVNDAPLVAPQAFSVVEDAFVRGAVVGIAGPVVDDDASDSATFALGLGADAGTWALNASGHLTLSRAVDFGPLDTRTASVVDGRLVRAVYRLTGRVTDAKSVPGAPAPGNAPITSVFNITVYVLVNSSYGGNPNVRSVEPPVGGFNTAGGQTFRILGSEFGTVTTLGGGRLNVTVETQRSDPTGPRTYVPTACVIAPDTITCVSPPGWGTYLAVFVRWGSTNRIMASDTVPLISYAPPTITGARVLPVAGVATPASLRAYSTDGTQGVNVSVANTGPAGTAVSVFYGPDDAPLRYRAVVTGVVPSRLASPGFVLCTLAPGVGADMQLVVVVGDSIASPRFNSSTGLISYAAPTVTDVVIASGSLGALLTAGGQTVAITGTNFGPLGVIPNVTYNATRRAVAVQGNAAVVTLAFAFANCRKLNPAAASTQVTCDTVAGVGQAMGVTLEVVGRVATLAGAALTTTLSYAAPTLTSVTGPGARAADTSGGQAVLLTGSNFGPAEFPSIAPGGDNKASLTARYGPLNAPTSFIAVTCEVLSQTQVQCLTAPGFGTGHRWILEVGGRNTSTLAANTGYGAPVISSIARSATDAVATEFRTPGGEGILIQGKNFGPQWLVNAGSFALFTLTVRDAVSDVGARLTPDALGRVTRNVTTCTMTVAHFTLNCSVPPMAGTDLAVTVGAGGLRSTQPRVGYFAPIIRGLALQDFAGNAIAEASVDGGALLVVTGANFGGPAPEPSQTCVNATWLPGLAVTCFGYVQEMTYGPSGEGNKVDRLHVDDHVTIRALVPAGFGRGLSLRLTVADQQSAPSALRFSYALPTITAVSWTRPDGGAEAPPSTLPPSGGGVVRVTGSSFSLLDPDSSVGVLWGNAADATRRTSVLRVNAFWPNPSAMTPAQVAAYLAQPEPRENWLEFTVPAGAPLPGRAIQVVVFPIGQPASAARVVSAANLDAGYTPPSVAAVVVSRPAGAGLAWLLANVPGASSNPSAYVQLAVFGASFGPNQTVAADTVTRAVELRNAADGTYSSAALAVRSWSDTSIVAFTTVLAATLRVRVAGRAGDAAAAPVEVASADYQYADLSPAVSALVGGRGLISTEGGASLTFTLQYIANTLSSLDVLVGGARAPTVTGPSGPISALPIAGVELAALIASPTVTVPGDPLASTWTLSATAPPGDGTEQYVRVLRDGRDLADSTAFVDYEPPWVTDFALWNASAGAWATVAYDRATAAGSTIVVPTAGGRVRVRGRNFGLCPRVPLPSGAELPLAGAGGAACVGGVAMPVAVANAHREIVFDVPEGTGFGATPFEVRARDQSTAGRRAGVDDAFPATPMWFSYAAPVIESVTPEGSTAGGDTITIRGANFGTVNPLVTIGGAACGVPVRTGHSLITCTLAEGAGGGLDVAVRAGNLTGTARGGFSYSLPRVSNITVVTAAGAVSRFAWAAGAPPLANVMPTRGNVSVTLTGANFGRGLSLADRSCLFVAWHARPLTAPLACDGRSNYVGEGELPALAIVAWSHTSITFLAPPGVGGRDVVPLVGGQRPAAPPFVLYATPRIADLAPRVGTTAGGDFVTLAGASFGAAAADTSTNVTRALLVDAPLPATVADYLTQPAGPTGIVVVNFFRGCISAHLDADGNRPAQVARCSSAIRAHGHEALTFISRPGIGVNRSVSVTVIDFEPPADAASPRAAAFNYSSPAVNFSYAAPWLTASRPRPVLLTARDAPKVVTFSGAEFGALPPPDAAPEEQWSAAEQAVDVAVGGLPCARPEDAAAIRVTAGGVTTLQCEVPFLPVGWYNVSYGVAGQRGFNASDSATAVFLACRGGFFARLGDTCAACPYGATCAGWVAQSSSSSSSSSSGAAGARRRRAQALVNSTLDRGALALPRPLPGFYTLNGSKYADCPAAVAVRYPGRVDACVVACEPAEACVGDNRCATGYDAAAPYWACNVCAKGFFRRGSECAKCPDSPAAVIVIFVLLVVAGAGVAYVLNKRNVNVAFIAIGVDWAQVVAIFANSKVKWPAAVKDLLYILSAFNLNIEIVAPECLVAGVTFRQRWTAVMVLPGVVAAIFAGVAAGIAVYRGGVKGQRLNVDNEVGSLASTLFLIMYVLYIYLVRTILDAWNCAEKDPSDGRSYLQASGDECYVPGLTQQALMPGAVVCFLGYVVGYPSIVAAVLWRNRKVAMEDQLLRAKYAGNDRLTGPRTFALRKRYSRIYYAFKPDYIFWVLLILLRKFLLAVTYIVFNRNAPFQLAAALIVLFGAYGLQVTHAPYMSPQNYDDVLRDHEMAALAGSPLHGDLREKLKATASRGKKAVRKNLLTAEGRVDPRQVVGVLATWFFAYNTVEEILLFSACLVALIGIMFTSLKEGSFVYAGARDTLGGLAIFVLIATIVYFFLVVVVEVVVLYTAESKARAMLRRQQSKAGKKGKDAGAAAAAAAAAAQGQQQRGGGGGGGPTGTMSTEFNPLFAESGTTDGSSASAASLREAVRATDAPGADLWRHFRLGYSSLQDDLQALSRQLAEAKIQQQRLESAAAVVADAADGAGGGGGGGYGGARASVASTTRRQKQEFSPSHAGAGAGGGGGGGVPGARGSTRGVAGGGGVALSALRQQR